jgi:LysR family transcriptional regulator, nod-box dependent transcriptional activator
LRVNRLDLHLLLVLDVIASEGSVTRAASRLHLSQAAISNCLRRLREHFDDSLVVPNKGRMTLTPFGAQIMDEVRDLVSRAQLLADTRLEFQPAKSSRRFTISMTDQTASVVMGPIARRLDEHGPGMGIEIRPLAGNPAAALDKGDLDFIVNRPGQMPPRFPYQMLYRDQYVCVAWSGHKPPGSVIGLEEYKESGHVLHRPIRDDDTSGTFASTIANLAKRILVTSPFLGALPYMVIGTPLLACVHRRLADRAARELPITIMPLPFEFPDVTPCAYWSPARESDPAHAWLREVLSEVAVGLQDAPDPVLEMSA